MVVVCLIIILLCLILYKALLKRKHLHGFSQCSTFLVYWFLIVLLGSFRFYRLYDISSLVYTLVSFGCISFFIGYAVLDNLASRPVKLENQQTQTRLVPLKMRWWYYVVLGFAVFVIIKQIVLLLPIIIASGMFEARGEMQLDDTLLMGGIWDILIAYFAKPFVKATMIVLLVNSFVGKFDIKHISIIIVLLLLYFFSEGGRGVLLEIIFATIYLFFAFKDKLSKKRIGKIKKSIVFLSLIPIVATLDRGSDILYSLYTYYCGSLTYLTRVFQNNQDLFNDYLYGWTSFQGFIKPFFGILEQIGFEKPESLIASNGFILSAQATVIDIAPSTPINYFMTCFGYAYKDGGILGVIIVMFIYGLMCSFIDHQEKKYYGSVRWETLKVFFFCCILFTMSYFPFAKYLNAMTIIYTYIITSKLFSKKSNI